MNDEIDPALIAILTQLWRAAQESPARAWSLAKLSKQSGLPMSSLRRQLTALSDTGLLDTTPSDAGVPAVALTEAGKELCAGLFAEGVRPEPDAG
ncbi:putative DNA-binding protein [Caballeronia sordidicola]|uniref:Putative DNA-binding protein n=1 Tax=Caballeronia sordidicola TaxID=196367 RepID=A0A158HFR4_CABSO|nr:helix-turn-helix domain-containing protein [Caballeronia sordidicola]SAL42849.1 putative DNA-binding protein [Caballeronia sordidicola]